MGYKGRVEHSVKYQGSSWNSHRLRPGVRRATAGTARWETFRSGKGSHTEQVPPAHSTEQIVLHVVIFHERNKTS